MEPGGHRKKHEFTRERTNNNNLLRMIKKVVAEPG